MQANALKYPDAPGYKADGPSKDAAVAETSRAAILRTQVVTAYHEAKAHELTADECAAALGESVLSIRPRVSELVKRDPPVLEDSGRRRANASGHGATVWRLVVRQTQPELRLV